LSVISTVLVFVIIPAAVIGAVAALVLSGSDRSKQQARRYRPGRPYDFPAMWFTATPQRAVTAGGGQRGLVIEDSSGAPVRPGSTGGASDKW